MTLLRVCAAVALAAFPGAAQLVEVDQAGYLPGFPKVATVVLAEEGTAFRIVRANDKKLAYEGKVSAEMQDADSGNRVRFADFTALDKPGTYYVEINGSRHSEAFRIQANVYARPYYLAMRAFYGQRCGIAVDLGREFPGFKHAACHLVGAYHVSSGKTGEHVSQKGWHDAGDYGRYIVNSGITTGTLLWTYEMFAPAIGSVSLNLPESGNSTPDILNEIRWNLDWMLTLQDTDGGVWHKQTSEKFCGFVMPEEDTLPSVVIGSGKEPYKTSCSTADFAAVMAIAGRVYQPFDAKFAAQALEAAKRAWIWLDRNPDALYGFNPAGVSTGAYGDRSCADERLWAAAELWRSTGNSTYHDFFLAQYPKFTAALNSPPSWPAVAPLALWTYALSGGQSEAEAVKAIREAMVKSADAVVERTARNGYHVSLTSNDYVWGSNGVVANYGMQLLVTNAVRKDRRYVEAALDNLHYLLGRNTHGLSFVTQVGGNPYRHPHHRPSGADSNAEPWPGLLSGGPNRRRQDPVMQKMLAGDLPPAKMFVDDQEAYAANEVAINWQAPLVFVLAGVIAAGGAAR